MIVPNHWDVLTCIFDYALLKEKCILGFTCQKMYQHYKNNIKPSLFHLSKAIDLNSSPSFAFLISYPSIQIHSQCLFNLVRCTPFASIYIKNMPFEVLQSMKNKFYLTKGMNEAYFFEFTNGYTELYKLNIFIDIEYIIHIILNSETAFSHIIEQNFHLDKALIYFVLKKQIDKINFILERCTPNSEFLNHVMLNVNKENFEFLINHCQISLTKDNLFYAIQNHIWDIASFILHSDRFIHFKEDEKESDYPPSAFFWNMNMKIVYQMFELGYSCKFITGTHIINSIRLNDYYVCELFYHPKFEIKDEYIEECIQHVHTYALECMLKHPFLTLKQKQMILSFQNLNTLNFTTTD